MCSGVLRKLAFIVSIFLLPVPAVISQDVAKAEEIQSFLRAASAQIPNIDKVQQSSMAFNIAGMQVRTGDLPGALATVQSVGDEQGRISALGNVVTALAWQGDLSSALHLIRDSSVGSRSSQENAMAVDRDYSAVAGSLADRHDFEGALRMVKLIEEGPSYFSKTTLVLETLLKIRFKQWQRGDQNGAEETLNLALQLVDREKQHPSAPEFATSMPAGMYGTIANELIREGDRTAALRILERDYGLIAQAPTPKQQQDTLFQFGYSLASIGEVQAADNITQQLENGQQREGVMMIIALQKIKQGDPFSVVPEVMSLFYEPWRNVSLRQIADILGTTGNYTQAIFAIERIEGAGERADGFSELALEQAERGSLAAALFVELAWEAALNGGSETKPYVFSQIAVARARLGDFAGALDIVPRVDVHERAWVLQNLTMILIHTGRKTEAIELAESQDVPEAKAHAFLGIAGEMFEESRAADANGSPKIQ